MAAAPVLMTWPPHEDALERALESGALAEIEAALLAAYEQTAESQKSRLHPSKVLEEELKKRDWKKTTSGRPRA